MQTHTFNNMQLSLLVLLLPTLSFSKMWPEFISPPNFGLIIPETQQPAPLQKINVNSDIKGNIAHSTITFTYKNEYNRTLTETSFRFPVSSDTAIYSLDALVNGVSFSGVVKEREQAEKDFQDAVDSGKAAVLVKENEKTSDILEMTVGNLGKGEIAVVTIKQVHELNVFKIKKKVLLSYLFPTSLFVRYTPENEDGIQEKSTTGSSFSGNISYSMDFSLNVWKSNNHGNNIEGIVVNENLAKNLKKEEVDVENLVFNDEKSELLSKFSFKNSKSVFGKDKDISINLIPKFSKFGKLDAAMFNDVESGIESSSPFEINNLNSTDFLQKTIVKSTFLVSPDWLKNQEESKPSEYVIIADCSGSMTGQRIENAKNMLNLLINSLPTDSFFNVIKFGSDFTPLFELNSEKYSRNSVEKALDFIKNVEADCGGTELVPAMEFVKNFEKKIQSRNIFVITDGAISNTDEAKQIASDFNDIGDRVFSFGIGAGASTELVNGLADSGNGYASFVHEYDNKELKTYFNDENLNEIIIKAIVAAGQNYIKPGEFCVKIEADFEDCVPVSNTSLPNVLVENEIFSHFSLFDENFDNGEISLKFGSNDNNSKLMSKWTRSATISESEFNSSPFYDQKSFPMHRLWAKREMQNLVKDYAKEGDWRKDTKALKEKIVELSVSSNVLSPFTGLVAVDNSGAVVDDSDLEPLIIENPIYMEGMNMNRALSRNMLMPARGRMPVMQNSPFPVPAMASSLSFAPSLPPMMEMAEMATTQSPALSVKKSSPESIYQSILAAQDFSGWFDNGIIQLLDNSEGNTDLIDFYKNVKTSEFKIIRSKTVRNLSQILPEKYFATVVAVVELLSPKYSNKANELKLILKKAGLFLETRNQSNSSKIWRAKWRKFSLAVAGKVANIRGYSPSKIRANLKSLFN